MRAALRSAGAAQIRSRVSPRRGPGRGARGRVASRASDFDAVADFELGESAEVEHFGEVVFAAEGGEHAGEVAEGGDLGAEALADVFAGGGAAEVFVGAVAGGLGDDLQLAAVGGELEEGFELFAVGVGERGLVAVGTSGAEFGEGGAEAAQVGLAHGGGDVDAAGD